MNEATKTVRVRVPVAVSPDGHWYAYGWHSASENDAQSVIYDMAGDEDLAWRWLVAEVELPAAQEVQADVES